MSCNGLPRRSYKKSFETQRQNVLPITSHALIILISLSFSQAPQALWNGRHPGCWVQNPAGWQGTSGMQRRKIIPQNVLTLSIKLCVRCPQQAAGEILLCLVAFTEILYFSKLCKVLCLLIPYVVLHENPLRQIHTQNNGQSLHTCSFYWSKQFKTSAIAVRKSLICTKTPAYYYSLAHHFRHHAL